MTVADRIQQAKAQGLYFRNSYDGHIEWNGPTTASEVESWETEDHKFELEHDMSYILDSPSTRREKCWAATCSCGWASCSIGKASPYLETEPWRANARFIEHVILETT